MIDIFHQSDITSLLKNKTLIFMGDSNIRALYKDFMCLLQKTQYIPERFLKQKMENTCFGDKLVSHGVRSNGRNYREERVAHIHKTSMSFFFLTKVYDDYVESVLKKITSNSSPDVIIFNCCLWDITRWGSTGVEKYKENLKILMKELKRLVPNCLVIWVTTPPIACDMRGGFLVKELQFLKYSLRFHVLEAIHYARKIVVQNGFDIMDSHYHLKMQLQRRTKDGIHWFPAAVRYVTNLLLTHISLAWDIPLPHRYESNIMEENMEAVVEGKIKFAESKVIEDQLHKVKPVVIPSTPTENNSQKNGKENYGTPVNKNNMKKIYPLPAKARQTHHAYMSRFDHEQRRKRNKRKRPATYSPTQHVPYDSQHDSGYFPSPSQISVSFPSMQTNPNFAAYSSVEQSPLAQSPNVFSSPYSVPNAYSNYMFYSHPLLPNPEPYTFPCIQPGQPLLPFMNFASNDVQFGTLFY